MIISMFFCVLLVFFVVSNIISNNRNDRLISEIKYHKDFIKISRNDRLYIGNESISKVRFIKNGFYGLYFA